MYTCILNTKHTCTQTNLVLKGRSCCMHAIKKTRNGTGKTTTNTKVHVTVRCVKNGKISHLCNTMIHFTVVWKFFVKKYFAFERVHVKNSLWFLSSNKTF